MLSYMFVCSVGVLVIAQGTNPACRCTGLQSPVKGHELRGSRCAVWPGGDPKPWCLVGSGCAAAHHVGTRNGVDYNKFHCASDPTLQKGFYHKGIATLDDLDPNKHQFLGDADGDGLEGTRFA
jgi:hypothetical protein